MLNGMGNPSHIFFRGCLVYLGLFGLFIKRGKYVRCQRLQAVSTFDSSVSSSPVTNKSPKKAQQVSMAKKKTGIVLRVRQLAGCIQVCLADWLKRRPCSRDIIAAEAFDTL